MNAILITPKNNSELKFIHEFLKRMRIEGKILSTEEKEDLGLAAMMQKADRTRKVSRETVMSKLKEK
jgi:hypothetical protein